MRDDLFDMLVKDGTGWRQFAIMSRQDAVTMVKNGNGKIMGKGSHENLTLEIVEVWE